MTAFFTALEVVTSAPWYSKLPFDFTHAYIDILRTVAREPMVVVYRGYSVRLNAGDMVFELRTLAKRWGWSPHRVSDFIIDVSRQNIITIISENSEQDRNEKETKEEQNGNEKGTKNKVITRVLRVNNFESLYNKGTKRGRNGNNKGTIKEQSGNTTETVEDAPVCVGEGACVIEDACVIDTGACAPVIENKKNEFRINSKYPKKNKVEIPKAEKPSFLASFPDAFQTPEFARVWEDWEMFRRELKKTLKPTTVQRQAKFLIAFGVEKAMRSIEQSITNGWTGLFDPDKSQTLGGAVNRVVLRERMRQEGF